MHRKLYRLLARAGALALSAMMAATPALAEMGSVAMIGGADGSASLAVAETDGGGEEIEISATVTAGKAGVSIESLGYSTSAACVGGDVYLLCDNLLLRLAAGADALECVAQYGNTYTYYAREDLQALSEEERVLAERTPSMIFEESGVLCGLSTATGVYGPLDAEGLIEKRVALDWSNMYTQYGVRDMQSVQVIGGALYALLAPVDTSDGYSDDDLRVTRFDLTTGEAKELGLEGQYNLSAYKDGLLLAYASWGGQENGVQAYDPAADKLGETVVPYVGYDSEETAGISYNGGGIVYDAESDTVYFVQNCMIYAYANGALTEIAYIPVDYGSNIRTAALAGESYFCTSWDGVYLRSMRPEDQPERSLHISGGYADDVTRSYTAKTDTPIIFENAWYADSESVRNDMLSGSSKNDIYVVSLEGGARALMEKGYLQPLNDSQALMDDVARMYPQLQEALMADGELYGYPQSFSMALWSVNPGLWAQFELGDYPTTFAGYVDLINTWNEDYAEDNPDYTVTSLYNGKTELLMQALLQYIYQYERPGAPLSFDTDAFRETMQAIETLDMDPVDWKNMSEADREEFWEKMNRPALFNMNGYETVEPAYDYYSTPEGNYEEALLKVILPPAFEEGREAVVPASLSMFVVNPESENVDLAMDFLEYYAANADAVLRYQTHTDLNEPVRQAYYEENREFYEKMIADMETAMADAADEDKQSFQETIDMYRAELENLEERSWRISEESLANYRELATHMYLPIGSLFLGGDGAALAVLEDVFMRYADGQIDLDAFIREIDQKIKMIYLENN